MRELLSLFTSEINISSVQLVPAQLFVHWNNLVNRREFFIFGSVRQIYQTFSVFWVVLNNFMYWSSLVDRVGYPGSRGHKLNSMLSSLCLSRLYISILCLSSLCLLNLCLSSWCPFLDCVFLAYDFLGYVFLACVFLDSVPF